MRLAVLALALAACGSSDPQYAGVGPYNFGKTTLADVTRLRCDKTKLEDGRVGSWCFGTKFKTGAHDSEVNLYFDGTEPTAALIEIQLEVRGCDEADLESWMTQSFGAPVERRNQRAYWKNAFVWAAGLLPERTSRCRIHLLPLSETSEIARIKAR